MYSIITPTFNRAGVLSQSIDSSISFAGDFCSNDELIIIDDASTDMTKRVVCTDYKSYFEQEFIKYHRLPVNRGVTFAKNKGALNAANEWLIFLDSDDQLLPGARLIISTALRDFPETDVFFFRCVDDDLNLVGPDIKESKLLSLLELVEHGTYGECLPVIKKSVFVKYPYDEDLRGFEGLSYLKMAMNRVVLRVIKDSARRYSLLGDDRLSTKLNLLKRADKILLGHKRYYDLIKKEVNIWIRILLLLKIFKYRLLLIVNLSFKLTSVFK